MARGRIPSVDQLELRLRQRKTRETSLKARRAAGPKPGTRGPLRREEVTYQSPYFDREFNIRAVQSGLLFFATNMAGIGILGLDAYDPANPSPPPFFKYGRVVARKGRAEAKVTTSELSKRQYLQYTPDDSRGTHNNFTAPLAGDTLAEIKTNLRAVLAAKRDDIGANGSIRYLPEYSPRSVSGIETGGGAGGA